MNVDQLYANVNNALLSDIAKEEKEVDEMTKLPTRRMVAPQSTAPTPPPPMGGGGTPPQMAGGGLPQPPQGAAPQGASPMGGSVTPTGGMPQGAMNAPAPMPPQGGGAPMPPTAGGAPIPAPQWSAANKTPAHLQGAPTPQIGGEFESLRAQQLQREGMVGGNKAHAASIPHYRQKKLREAMKVEQEFQIAKAYQTRNQKISDARTAADQIYKTALAVSGDPEMAKLEAEGVLNQPDTYKDVNGKLLDMWSETHKVNLAKVKEKSDSKEMEEALKLFEIPEIVSYGMAQTDGSLKDNVELWRKVMSEGTLAQQEAFKQEVAKTGAYAQVDNTIKQINNTLGYSTGFGATGLASVFYSKIPSTDAYATLKSVDTQRAVNAFLELMNMRKASETGGALGNVSNREIELLYNAYTNLDPTIGEGFNRNMVDVLQRFERVKFMLANEKRFEREGWTAEEMFNAATNHVNLQVASKMKGDMKPSDKAIKNLLAYPETADQFEAHYGWSPISYEMEEDLSGLRGGHDNLR